MKKGPRADRCRYIAPNSVLFAHYLVGLLSTRPLLGALVLDDRAQFSDIGILILLIILLILLNYIAIIIDKFNP